MPLLTYGLNIHGVRTRAIDKILEVWKNLIIGRTGPGFSVFGTIQTDYLIQEQDYA